MAYFQRDTLISQYGGCVDSPWDEISIRYVMVASYVARKRPGEAFNEQSQLISCVYTRPGLENDHDDIPYRQFFRFFTQNAGWTLPALFSMLRDLRDLAFDVSSLFDTLSFRFDVFRPFRPTSTRVLIVKIVNAWRVPRVWWPRHLATV